MDGGFLLRFLQVACRGLTAGNSTSARSLANIVLVEEGGAGTLRALKYQSKDMLV